MKLWKPIGLLAIELSDSNAFYCAILFGGGYGSTNGQHYWILHHKLRKYGYDIIEVLLQRQIPVNTG